LAAAGYVVHSFILESGVRGKVHPEFDIFKSGAIDSLSLLGFVISLEKQLQITLSNEEIASPEFRKVGTLIDLLAAKMP
jgi:acyl carrier protein